KEFPKVKLIFAGRGEMFDELSNQALKLDLVNDVIFTGFVEEDKKPLYFKAADIFCLPSTTMAESFGIVNLEAMASGIPIVASNLGGIPDIVKHGVNGLLAEPGNDQNLADALSYLLKNEKLRNKMGITGKEFVKEYSWQKITKETDLLYKSILENWK
ncbi:MAG: glycosyltransferase family 4 protein, partial [Methanobacterium sp.]